MRAWWRGEGDASDTAGAYGTLSGGTFFTPALWMRGTHAQPAGDYAVIEKSHGFVDNTGWFFQADSTSSVIAFGFGTGSTFVGAEGTGLDMLDGFFRHVAGTWSAGVGRL